MIPRLPGRAADDVTRVGCGWTRSLPLEHRIRRHMPNYTVKEIFYTLQGEGFHTGRSAVFCRFSGCNLWTGREDDRHKSVCTFCDTEFVGVGPDGGKFSTARDLAARVASHWPEAETGNRYVVCTG